MKKKKKYVKLSVEFVPLMAAASAESDTAGGAMAYPDPDYMWTEDGYQISPNGSVTVRDSLPPADPQ